MIAPVLEFSGRSKNIYHHQDCYYYYYRHYVYHINKTNSNKLFKSQERVNKQDPVGLYSRFLIMMTCYCLLHWLEPHFWKSTLFSISYQIKITLVHTCFFFFPLFFFAFNFSGNFFGALQYRTINFTPLISISSASSKAFAASFFVLKINFALLKIN